MVYIVESSMAQGPLAFVLTALTTNLHKVLVFSSHIQIYESILMKNALDVLEHRLFVTLWLLFSFLRCLHTSNNNFDSLPSPVSSRTVRVQTFSSSSSAGFLFGVLHS